MLFLRAAVERVLLLFFALAQSIFVLQGLSTGCALVAVFALGPTETPPWLRSTLISTLLVSATYFISGVLIFGARHWCEPRASGDIEPAWPWPGVLGISLLILSVYAAIASSRLPPVWNQISTYLTATGFWDEWARGGSNSALLLLPILLALYVPVQVTAAALFSIAFPLSLLPLLTARSRLFPSLLVRGAVCQTALVLTSWLATDILGRVGGQALAAMDASGDPEVLRVAGDLDRATGVLTQTAIALVAPLLVTLAWLVFLRPSGAAASYFTQGGACPAPVEASRKSESVPTAPLSADAGVETLVRTPVSEARVSRSRSHIGLALAVPGALMLMFAAADGLRTRASFVSSQPEPGAILSDPPAVVRIKLDAPLDPASSLAITRLVNQPDRAGVFEVEIVRRLAPDDLQRRTLEGVSAGLTAGLYRVTWTALPAGGGVARHGSYSFGVGVPVPSDTNGTLHSLQERDSGARGRRQTVLGGVLLLVLGAVLPRLSSR